MPDLASSAPPPAASLGVNFPVWLKAQAADLAFMPWRATKIVRAHL